MAAKTAVGAAGGGKRRGRSLVLRPIRAAANLVMRDDVLTRPEIVDRLAVIGIPTTVSQLDQAMNLRSDDCGDYGYRHTVKYIGDAKRGPGGKWVAVVYEVPAYAVVSAEAHHQIALERGGTAVKNHLPQYRKIIVDIEAADTAGLGHPTDAIGIPAVEGVVDAMLVVQRENLTRLGAEAATLAAQREAAMEDARHLAEVRNLDELSSSE